MLKKTVYKILVFCFIFSLAFSQPAAFAGDSGEPSPALTQLAAPRITKIRGVRLGSRSRLSGTELAKAVEKEYMPQVMKQFSTKRQVLDELTDVTQAYNTVKRSIFTQGIDNLVLNKRNFDVWDSKATGETGKLGFSILKDTKLSGKQLGNEWIKTSVGRIDNMIKNTRQRANAPNITPKQQKELLYAADLMEKQLPRLNKYASKNLTEKTVFIYRNNGIKGAVESSIDPALLKD
jgi:hypothetical protein